MERQSVRQVLDEIRGMTFHNSCILIADRGGHAVCLEMAAGRIDVRDVSGTAFGHANNILAKPLLEFEKKGPASSPLRQKRVDALLKERGGAFTAATMQGVFRDHAGFPLSICRHPSNEDPQTTNAAFVADLKTLRMHIAVGNPCAAGFQTYELPPV
jgi:isopenicillin-N N-acyltransferase-like protein